MHRLALLSEDVSALPLQSAPPEEQELQWLPKPQVRVAEESSPHASFVPMHYESGYSYPLLIWLHGSEGHESQLRQVMPLVSTRNHIGLAPRGTKLTSQNDQLYDWSQAPSHVAAAEERVFRCIAKISSKLNINSKRIFLAGNGSGGTMAVRIAWNHPELFAGAATLGGQLPSGQRPMRNLAALRQLPLLICSGQKAAGYGEAKVCSDLRLLHTAGMVVGLRQYPCGDELRTTMLSDLDKWMMEIVCGSKSEAEIRQPQSEDLL